MAKSVVSHAGAQISADIVDGSTLTGRLSTVLAWWVAAGFNAASRERCPHVGLIRLSQVDGSWAAELAERYLAAALPKRWVHVQAVAARVAAVALVVRGDHELVVSAAWLHDVGYAPVLAMTGLHPLDGARFLRDLGADSRLCGLVAHHSGAAIEAELRGLADELNAEFPRERSSTADALWYADLTTGPEGEMLTLEERLAEIAERYGPGDVVTEFVKRARPELFAAVRRTEVRLEDAPAAQSR